MRESLIILSITSAFYIGYSSAGKGKLDWFIVTAVIVIYITLDLDRPRRGLIKMDSNRQTMIDLRKL